MFKNERYLSRGVNYTIPLELQLFLWECVERIRWSYRSTGVNTVPERTQIVCKRRTHYRTGGNVIMGMLSKIFKIDKETEQEIKAILKYMSAIALIVAAGKTGVELGALPFDEDKEG